MCVRERETESEKVREGSTGQRGSDGLEELRGLALLRLRQRRRARGQPPLEVELDRGVDVPLLLLHLLTNEIDQSEI